MDEPPNMASETAAKLNCREIKTQPIFDSWQYSNKILWTSKPRVKKMSSEAKTPERQKHFYNDGEVIIISGATHNKPLDVVAIPDTVRRLSKRRWTRSRSTSSPYCKEALQYSVAESSEEPMYVDEEVYVARRQSNKRVPWSNDICVAETPRITANTVGEEEAGLSPLQEIHMGVSPQCIWNAEERAATTIQTQWRRYKVCKWIKGLGRATIKLQAVWRGFSARRRVSQQNKAAMMLQKAFRNFRAIKHLRQKLGENKQLEWRCAVKIQTIVRMWLAAKRRGERLAAILTIQRRLRRRMVLEKAAKMVWNAFFDYYQLKFSRLTRYKCEFEKTKEVKPTQIPMNSQQNRSQSIEEKKRQLEEIRRIKRALQMQLQTNDAGDSNIPMIDRVADKENTSDGNPEIPGSKARQQDRRRQLPQKQQLPKQISLDRITKDNTKNNSSYERPVVVQVVYKRGEAPPSPTTKLFERMNDRLITGNTNRTFEPSSPFVPANTTNIVTGNDDKQVKWSDKLVHVFQTPPKASQIFIGIPAAARRNNSSASLPMKHKLPGLSTTRPILQPTSTNANAQQEHVSKKLRSCLRPSECDSGASKRPRRDNPATPEQIVIQRFHYSTK